MNLVHVPERGIGSVEWRRHALSRLLATTASGQRKGWATRMEWMEVNCILSALDALIEKYQAQHAR